MTNVQLDQAVLMLSMLTELTRLLWALRDCELDVSTWMRAAECTPTAASQHLSKLRMVGLVQQRADGRARRYRRRVGTCCSCSPKRSRKPTTPCPGCRTADTARPR
jgi:DNA-binding transcriptional ArsR family regulator